MASIIKVDRILDSTELGKVDIPGGIETDVLNAAELVADTWKNVDGTENYKCRAWCNFDGTTTPPTIRASGNVSSVVRNGIGDYTVNFNIAMPDTKYAWIISGSNNFRTAGPGEGTAGSLPINTLQAPTVSSLRLLFPDYNGTLKNIVFGNVLVFR